MWFKNIWKRIRCHHEYEYLRTKWEETGYGEDGPGTAHTLLTDVYKCKHCGRTTYRNQRYR